MITEEARNTMDGNVVVRVVAEVAAWGAKGEETLGNYFTDESEGMREYLSLIHISEPTRPY